MIVCGNCAPMYTFSFILHPALQCESLFRFPFRYFNSSMLYLFACLLITHSSIYSLSFIMSMLLCVSLVHLAPFSSQSLLTLPLSKYLVCQVWMNERLGKMSCTLGEKKLRGTSQYHFCAINRWDARNRLLDTVGLPNGNGLPYRGNTNWIGVTKNTASIVI